MVVFEATDDLSGIDYYKIKVGDNDFVDVSPDNISHGPYVAGPLDPGSHVVLVQAFDRAGNYTTGSKEITILPIDTPVVDEYQRTLHTVDFLVIRGTTYPDALITVFLQYKSEQPKSFVISSNNIGKFSFVSDDHLKDGPYRFWVTVTDKTGAKSLPTNKYLVLVERDSFIYFGDIPVSILVILLLLVLSLLVAILVVILIYRNSFVSRRALVCEITEAKASVHRTLNYLRDIVRRQVEALGELRTKHEIIQGEKKAVEEIERNLGQAERFLHKEIQDIEDSLPKK